MTSNILTASRLRTFRACQRLHHYEYELGYRLVQDAPPLRFGTLIHLMLAAWWLATKNGLVGTERLRRALTVSVPNGTDLFDMAKARAMMTGYEARYGTDKYSIAGIEEEFAVDLPGLGRYRLAGKLDVRLAGQSSSAIMEHKTSSEDISPGSSYWAKLRMDGQVSAYFLGAKALGHEIESCIYDVLGKPSIRPKHAESPEQYEKRCMEAIGTGPSKYFQRGTVTRLESELEEAMVDIVQTADQLEFVSGDKKPTRNPDACEKWGRVCPFFGVCTHSESLENKNLFKRLENVHPELEAR